MASPEFETPEIRSEDIQNHPLLQKLWSSLENILGVGFWGGLITGLALGTASLSASTVVVFPELFDQGMNLLKISAVSGVSWGIARSIRWVGIKTIRFIDTFAHH